MTRRKEKRRRLLFFWGLWCFAWGIMPGAVKTVYIPEKIDVEENGAKETVVRNLAEQEIFDKGFIHIYDEFIYYQQQRPVEIIKLDLKGNVVKRLNKYGEGPGEFVNSMGLREYKGDIAFIDFIRMKFLVYTKEFKFIRETKMEVYFLDFFVNRKNEIVFYSKSGHTDYYFYVYSEDAITTLRKFGKTTTTLAENKKIKTFDAIREILYLPGNDGLWASFKNRYDIRYYENEKLAVEINGPKGFFRGEEQEAMGKKYIIYKDRATLLAQVKNNLYYFYTKDKSTFCDIFNMNSYKLSRRIKLKNNYWYCLAHCQDNVFYGGSYDAGSEDEDVILYRIQIKNSQFENLNDK